MAKRKKLPEAVGIDLDNPEFKRLWELICNTEQSIFLTGKAGTGKSTFLRYITEHTSKQFVVLAPTGIAAVNVGGQTLHSFFRIPFKPLLSSDPDFAPQRIRERLKYPGSLVKLIRKLELIIIDEISMVRADILDFIDKVLRIYSGETRRPFGGKQLLLVGDVFQLEPVVTADMRDILRKEYATPFFFSAHAFDTINLVTIELRKIYRQTEGEFVELLDRIRTGAVSRDDIARLNSRHIPPASLPLASEAEAGKPTMILAARRDMVDHINQSRLEAIERPEFTFTGRITGDFPENSLPTDLELSLKEEAQVVFIKNNPDRLWVNGTIGKVETLAADHMEVRLENGDVHVVEPEKWSNIKYSYDSKSGKIVEEELGSFTQYPVKLAWALTIHKSQGLTFDNVDIDLGRGAFAGGQTYVALSRCRSFEGLTLRSSIAERDIWVNPAVVKFSHTFNDEMAFENAISRSKADRAYSEAALRADAGDLPGAFDRFVEGMRARSIIDDESAVRLVRRKLGIVKELQARIDELQAQIMADRGRFAEMAAEYVSLGHDCLSDDMPLPAIANFSKALTLQPRHREALLGRSEAYLAVDEAAGAVEDLSLLVSDHPSDFTALCRLADAYLTLPDLHNALNAALRALDLTEDAEPPIPRRGLVSLHTLLGDIYTRAGDKAAARRHAALARRLSKEN